MTSSLLSFEKNAFDENEIDFGFALGEVAVVVEDDDDDEEDADEEVEEEEEAPEKKSRVAEEQGWQWFRLRGAGTQSRSQSYGARRCIVPNRPRPVVYSNLSQSSWYSSPIIRFRFFLLLKLARQ